MRTTRREVDDDEVEEEEHCHYHHHHPHNNDKKHKKQFNQRREARICRALCCCCRSLSSSSSSSSSSSEETLERNSRLVGDQHGSLSRLTHYTVQEKLEQMIKERQEAIQRENTSRRMTRRPRSGGGRTKTKFIMMMAMAKCSYDPREDFRDSMIEMIVVNRIHGAKELRSLLEHYLLMNSQENKSIILEIFHKVCTDLFLSS